MADRYTIPDLTGALADRRFPSVTLWNRLEGRPRTVDFSRALRAEVRDALWMLTRQWQTGEFRGEDAGSPVFAKVRVDTTEFTRLAPGGAPSVAFDAALPLEAQGEQQPWRNSIARGPVALDLRLVLGRRWLRQIAPIGNYADLYIDRYRIRRPDPMLAADAAVCAHVPVWQAFAAAAERTVDGVALYEYLTGGPGRHAYDGIAVLGAHMGAIDTAARAFVAWAERMVLRPSGGENPAWQPDRLEYQFACSAPVAAGEKTYTASEYANGRLDWHAFDAEPVTASAGVSGADPRASITRTMIPVPLTYAGMPHARWWTIEDGRTNFGAIRPDTTDLAKLLFIEFGLVYSNDWFIVPLTLPAGSIATVRGLAVTTVFGERRWIEAAGNGADAAWQRWGMFGVNRHGRDAREAETALLLLPTVPKVQESRPLEEVLLIRDEIANMVWAIEKTIPAPDGVGRSGSAAARETRAYHERLVAAAGGVPAARRFANDAQVAFEAMSSVPEQWIPMIPVRAQGSTREITLQRGAMARLIDRDPSPPARIQPRTSIVRAGLDEPSPRAYFVAEEEVPRAGLRLTLTYQRTRAADGRVFVWRGVRKQTGRGEGSSGLAFDRLIDKPKSD